jgi:hypothetical protein
MPTLQLVAKIRAKIKHRRKFNGLCRQTYAHGGFERPRVFLTHFVR